MDIRPFSARVTSRRFLITTAVAVLVLVAEKIGLSLSEAELLALAGVVGTYNLKDAVAKPAAPDQ